MSGSAVRYRLALVALAAAWLFGGASRFDVITPFVASVIGMVVIATLWATGRIDRLTRGEWICWGILLAIFAFQLIPLPPAIWQSLPGHAFPRDFFALVGEAPWLPLSLTPSRTLSSLFAVFPPLAVYLAARGLSRDDGDRLLTWLVAFACMSVILGIFQIVGGPNTALRPYSITNRDAAVGLFSNANHFGVWLSCSIPATAYLGMRLLASESRAPRRTIIAITAGIIALVAIGAITSFSRAAYGAALIMSAFAASAILLRSHLSRRLKLAVGIGALVFGAVVVAFVSSTGTLERIAEVSELGQRGRLQMVPVFARIVADTLPLGTGVGSFDAINRAYEDYSLLGGTYLNNAHNEPAQVLIEAGILGFLAVVAWLIWLTVLGRNAVGHARSVSRGGLQIIRTSALFLPIIILLAHSLVDYPLRASATAATFALFVALLFGAGRKTNFT